MSAKSNRAETTQQALDRVNKQIERRRRRHREDRERDSWDRLLGSPFIQGSVYERMEAMGDPRAWGGDD